MVEIFDNIRKIYQFSPPCAELADHIEFFSESSDDATYTHIGNACFTVKMFPSWTPTFWFNLGSPYQLRIEGQRYKVSAETDILIIRDHIVERVNQPTDHIFSIKFFPGGLEAVFDIDQSKLKNRVIHLQEILPPSLITQVKKLNDFSNRVQLLQHFFLSHLRKKKSRDHYMHFVRDTIACYEEGQLHYNVNEISARLFTSSKTINRYFNKIIGTSPKNYFNIMRARTALTAWIADRRTFQPTDFGFYDPSHFYKEMNKFTEQKLSLSAG
jgi:AraC-like DNA-binding protein